MWTCECSYLTMYMWRSENSWQNQFSRPSSSGLVAGFSRQWNILQAQYYQLLLLGTLLLHNLCLMLDSSTFHLVYSATYLKQQLSNIQTSHSFLNTLALKSGPFPDDKHYPNPPIHFYPYTKTTRKCDFFPTKLHCVAKIIINETQNYLQEKRIIWRKANGWLEIKRKGKWPVLDQGQKGNKGLDIFHGEL